MKKFFVLLLCSTLSLWGFGQELDGLNKKDALNVYFDCGSCDLNFFRENLTIINYVRDRKVANVQIIVSTMQNGGGGTEYSFQFIGLGRFSKFTDTLVMHSKADDTSGEIRDQQLHILQRGLTPFILKTPYSKFLEINYKSEEQKQAVSDPWNKWVFSIGGSLWANGQQSYNSISVNTDMSGYRITEKIKHQTALDVSFNSNKYRLYDGNDSLLYAYDSYRRSYYFNHSTIWSLGPHWGAGVEATISHSDYSNNKQSFQFQPAVEYNFFEYAEASRKQLRLAYSMAYMYRDYIDTTIYNKISEQLFQEKLELNYKYITSWGSLRTGLYWTNYMHDFSLYSVGGNVNISVRLFKGLSVSLYSSMSLPRNQISLVNSESTSEDVLLRQTELATQYSYYASFGISYTFGSIYNNVVNPRLD